MRPVKKVEERLVCHDRPLSVTLLAELLGVSRVTVYAWLKSGKLADTRISTVVRYAKGGEGRRESE